jgi:hypothetical protein
MLSLALHFPMPKGPTLRTRYRSMNHVSRDRESFLLWAAPEALLQVRLRLWTDGWMDGWMGIFWGMHGSLVNIAFMH